MNYTKKFKYLLVILLTVSFLIRIYQLDNPNAYVFDEVYHAFTAKEYLNGSKEAWEWWTQPPPGVAYEWTHPPLAKELMSVSMIVTNSTDPWGWRLFGVIFGTINIFLVYLLARYLFKDNLIALTAAFIYSFDGLSFVQARTGMNDTYLLTFILLSLIFFVKEKYLFSAICFGLALSSKWSSIYLLPIITLLLIYREKYYLIFKNFNPKLFFQKSFKLLQIFLLYILIPPIVYLITYLPFFMLGHNFDTFIQLQQQMWWYHTQLKATHNYTSPWWSWPFNLYPVWYYVNYADNKIGNIFASGNPIVFWAGFTAVLLCTWDFFKNRSFALLVVLLGYFLFWLPWSLSPRIMFLYHYTPTLPFLSIALAYQLKQITTTNSGQKAFIIFLLLIAITFLLLYPFLTATLIPRELVPLFFLTNDGKNPFQ